MCLRDRLRTHRTQESGIDTRILDVAELFSLADQYPILSPLFTRPLCFEFYASMSPVHSTPGLDSRRLPHFTTAGPSFAISYHLVLLPRRRPHKDPGNTMEKREGNRVRRRARDCSPRRCALSAFLSHKIKNVTVASRCESRRRTVENRNVSTGCSSTRSGDDGRTEIRRNGAEYTNGRDVPLGFRIANR